MKTLMVVLVVLLMASIVLNIDLLVRGSANEALENARYISCFLTFMRGGSKKYQCGVVAADGNNFEFEFHVPKTVGPPPLTTEKYLIEM